MLPPQPPPGTSRGEVTAFRALEALPTDWTVFHSVVWFNEQREGEGDFIVVHPAGGLLFVEVKGRCSVDASGQWTRYRSNVVVKDPWTQAQTTGREVVRRLKRAGVERRPAAFLGCFPAGEPRFVGGLARQQQRSVAAADLEDSCRLQATLEDALLDAAARDEAPLRPFSEYEAQAIRTVLLVTGQVHVPVGRSIIEGDERRGALTDQQTRIYVELMRARRMLTTGGAGTGKTLLAAARAAQLSKHGQSTLVIVAHRLLAQRVELLLAKNGADPTSVSVVPLSRLAFDLSGSEWEAEDLQDVRKWKSALAGAPLHQHALVVDDAQHLPPDLVAALAGARAGGDTGDLYLFADPAQTTVTGWVDEVRKRVDLPVEVGLDRNCRNTRQICEIASRLVGRQTEPSDIEGVAVTLTTADSRTEAARLAQDAATAYLRDGLPANGIAVIYDDVSWYRDLWPARDGLVHADKNDWADWDDWNWEDLDEWTQWVDEDEDEDADSDEIEREWVIEDPDETVAWVPDADNLGGAYVVRRRTALMLPGVVGGVVRCLHLESAIGLEFDAVVLLLSSWASNEDANATVLGDDYHGELSDDDGFDAGVWLRSLSGDGAVAARAYVGVTRAKTALTVIGPAEALAPLLGTANDG